MRKTTTTTNNKIPTEHEEQCALVQWIRISYPQESKLFFAIPNGGARHPIVAIHMKQEGVLAGVPDTMLAIPRGGYHGLFIEMKKRKGGVISQAQKEMIQLLNQQGYCATVCKGADEAYETFKKYLKGEKIQQQPQRGTPNDGKNPK